MKVGKRERERERERGREREGEREGESASRISREKAWRAKDCDPHCLLHFPPEDSEDSLGLTTSCAAPVAL